MAEKNNSYMIDVAKDSTYLNQSDEYRKSYAEWRADPDNVYGYQFVHDMREHSYIDGKGYVPHLAEVAESLSLVKCCSLMGVSFLLMFLVDLAWHFFSLAFTSDNGGFYIYKSQIDNPTSLSFVQILVGGTVVLVRYLLPALIFAKVTGIPKKVVFPKSRRRYDLIGHAVIIMLLIMVMGRIITMFTSHVYGLIKVDTLYSVLYFSREPAGIAAAFFFNCIAIPIVQEILFRGVLLQTFRQFGDFFAVLTTSFLGALCFYDLTYYGQVSICFIVLGVVTVRTGSIYAPIIMSVVSHTVNFILSYLELFKVSQADLIEKLVIAVILGVSIMGYNTLMNEKHKIMTVTQAKSGMRMVKKVQVLISTMSIALWISASLIMTFIVMRML